MSYGDTQAGKLENLKWLKVKTWIPQDQKEKADLIVSLCASDIFSVMLMEGNLLISHAQSSRWTFYLIFMR